MAFIFSFFSCTPGQDKRALTLNIRAIVPITNNLNIECVYINQSDSVLLLPIKYFNEVAVQSFVFKDKSVRYGGSDNQIVIDKVEVDENAEAEVKEKLLKDYCGLNREDYYQLKPSDTLKLRYSLQELQYIGIKKGEQYEVQVRLHITNDFKETCPRMWVGNAESEFSLIKF